MNSYFLNTGLVREYDFGQVYLRTTGVAGQFRLCTETPSTVGYVAYINGTRSTGTIAGNACSGILDPGAGGDFEINCRRSKIYGVHSGDSLSNENYSIYGMSALF